MTNCERRGGSCGGVEKKKKNVCEEARQKRGCEETKKIMKLILLRGDPLSLTVRCLIFSALHVTRRLNTDIWYQTNFYTLKKCKSPSWVDSAEADTQYTTLTHSLGLYHHKMNLSSSFSMHRETDRKTVITTNTMLPITSVDTRKKLLESKAKFKGSNKD